MSEDITDRKGDPVIWTVSEVADYLRMSRTKVYRLVREHRIPGVRIGNAWRFRKDLLDDWLSQSSQVSIEPTGK